MQPLPVCQPACPLAASAPACCSAPPRTKPPTPALIAEIETLLAARRARHPALCRPPAAATPRGAPAHHRTTGASWKRFLLAGDTSAEVWLKALLQDELPADAYGRLLLMPGAKAPVAVKARGKQVCTCFNVSEEAIQAQLASSEGSDEQRFAELQTGLKCGTNCGSCIPELRRLVKPPPPVAGRLIAFAYNPQSSRLPDNRQPWESVTTSKKSGAAKTAPVRSTASRPPT